MDSIMHQHVTSFHPPNAAISLCSFTCKQLDQDHTMCWYKRNQVLSKYKFLILNHYLLQKTYWSNLSSSLETSGCSPHLYQMGAQQRSQSPSYSGSKWSSLFLFLVLLREKKNNWGWVIFFSSKTYLLPCGVNFIHKWALK